jgi:hypothetical protein
VLKRAADALTHAGEPSARCRRSGRRHRINAVRHQFRDGCKQLYPEIEMKRFIPTLALIAMATTASAQDMGAARKACMADFQKYCTGVSPGGGRIRKCLTDNLDKLTPDCRSAVAASSAGGKRE